VVVRWLDGPVVEVLKALARPAHGGGVGAPQCTRVACLQSRRGRSRRCLGHTSPEASIARGRDLLHRLADTFEAVGSEAALAFVVAAVAASAVDAAVGQLSLQEQLLRRMLMLLLLVLLRFLLLLWLWELLRLNLLLSPPRVPSPLSCGFDIPNWELRPAGFLCLQA
jgi:hypothetical protein